MFYRKSLHHATVYQRRKGVVTDVGGWLLYWNTINEQGHEITAACCRFWICVFLVFPVRKLKVVIELGYIFRKLF